MIPGWYHRGPLAHWLRLVLLPSVARIHMEQTEENAKSKEIKNTQLKLVSGWERCCLTSTGKRIQCTMGNIEEPASHISWCLCGWCLILWLVAGTWHVFIHVFSHQWPTKEIWVIQSHSAVVHFFVDYSLNAEAILVTVAIFSLNALHIC